MLKVGPNQTSITPPSGAKSSEHSHSIESTRIYLHLANDWLSGEYLRAAEAIEAQSVQP